MCQLFRRVAIHYWVFILETLTTDNVPREIHRKRGTGCFVDRFIWTERSTRGRGVYEDPRDHEVTCMEAADNWYDPCVRVRRSWDISSFNFS